MGCQQGNLWSAEKKSVTTKYSDADWLEYYKLLNKWYRDGILAQDYLGVRPEDFFSRNESGQVFAYSYNWGLPGDVNSKWRDTDFGGKFDDLSKPYMRLIEGSLTYKGEDNLPKVSSDYGTGWSSCFISTNCENPGRAICFMEFMKSPFGDKLTQWGIEGVHYELVDGLPKNLESFQNRPDEEKGSDYTGIGPWYLQGSDRMEGVSSKAGATINAADQWAAEDGAQGIADRTVKKAACYANKNPAMSFARVEADDEEYAMNSKIADQWAKSVAAMITAESEAAVEQYYNEFVTYATDAGIAAVEARMTARYLEYLKIYQDNGYFTDIKVD
jgi:putative aldouronate transport system substrate-binding protein